MSNFRKFCISGGLFNGYETIINLDYINSNDDIIKIVISNLYTTIKNMRSLESALDSEKAKYHIHGKKFGEILLTDSVFYICTVFSLVKITCILCEIFYIFYICLH